MKLTNNDKELLKEWGYQDDDMKQIEQATRKTDYEIDGEKISTKKALDVLGREKYLNGISRSAFHWSSTRSNENGKTVYFDSSRLFK